MSVRVSEIFSSLQGETSLAGLPTTFVRLTGCPLRCDYCDTAYAFHGGQRMTLPVVLDRVAELGFRTVCLTGGEPLAQPGALELLTALCDRGYRVSLETSGALDISRVDPRVVRVLDFKTPGSGEVARNLWRNVHHLNPQDQVKFVLCDRADYEWARLKCAEHQLADRCAELLFSPSAGQLGAADLAAWMLEDRVAARLQLQLHKIIWGDEPGR